MPIDYVAVGKRIRELRRKLGITQLELSEMINVSPPHMSNIENGNKNVGVETLVKIANVLHISTDELLEDNLEGKLVASPQTFATLIQDCSDYERRVFLGTLTALKTALIENRKYYTPDRE